LKSEKQKNDTLSFFIKMTDGHVPLLEARILEAMKKVDKKNYGAIVAGSYEMIQAERDVQVPDPNAFFSFAIELQKADLEKLVQLQSAFHASQDKVRLTFLRENLQVFKPEVIAKVIATSVDREVIENVLKSSEDPGNL
jgi:hypothetical protein